MHTVIVTFLSFFTVFSHRTPSIFPPEKKKKTALFQAHYILSKRKKVKIAVCDGDEK